MYSHTPSTHHTQQPRNKGTHRQAKKGNTLKTKKPPKTTASTGRDQKNKNTSTPDVSADKDESGRTDIENHRNEEDDDDNNNNNYNNSSSNNNNNNNNNNNKNR